MTELFRRSSLLALTILILAGLVVPAGASTPTILATEAEPEVTEEAPAVDYQGPDAFISVEDATEDELVPAWTYRYLIPTTMVLIALLVVALVVGYFLRVVRTRYTVVE